MQTQANVDDARLHDLLGRAVMDMGATFHAPLVLIGERLGLYKTLAGEGPLTPADLAEKTGTTERYVREWLNAQAAGGYVTHEDGRYRLTPEQAACLADETSPTYLPGGFQLALSSLKAQDRIERAFRTGEGMGWHEHDAGLFHATERFFRPNYAANLVTSWIPALDGVKEKLERGARVADIGCGHGSSTVLMAQAFPASTFTGFDYHEGSVEAARAAADRAGVADRARFETATAKSFPGTYDFIAFFDSLHDMGDPEGAARHVLEALEPGGTWMVVEPFAKDGVDDNLNPVGRLFYSVSTLVCTPNSLSQEVGTALGAQAGEARLREIVTSAGFSRFRRATETPFNLVFEARA